MKRTTLLTLILLTTTVALGQGVAINETGAEPDPSAMLDVTSTSKGLLVPRMTIAQRNAIVLPNPGLLIFQTDATPGFYYNANTASSPNWQRLGDGSAGQWTISGDNIYYNAGNVGIGTNTPAAQLHTLGLGTGQGNVLFTGENKPVSPGNPPATGPGTRLMWYPDKAAFRAGQVTGTQWNMDNIGYVSNAWGYNNSADGPYATAFGSSSGASGEAATAWGSSGANGDFSTTWGFANAAGDVATAWGESEANGYLSTTWGIAIADGNYTTAWGSSQAQGIYATAWGVGTKAESYAETVFGRYNEIYGPYGPDVWDPIDRLFVIGNGNSHMQRANALTVLKNGRIGMGISQPLALLHTHGIGTGEGNVLFTGQFKSDAGAGNPPATGAGTRMMWYPDKAAFRAGYVVTDQWNKTNIGFHSFAMGSSNKASGRYSAAWGTNNTASGEGATAWGYINNATGDFSTAFGDGANASGKYSTAMGRLTSAPSFAETVIGQYNLTYTPASATSWNTNDRLFVIANGASAGTRSNAVTVMKSGNVGIGIANPTETLDVDGQVRIRGGAPGDGKVLTSDVNGVGSWQTTNWIVSGADIYRASGNVGIGTTDPTALLHTKGTGTGEGNVLFEGSQDLNSGDPPASGAGTRMMWYPAKAAFRAGWVYDSEWDKENIGDFSIALGFRTTASGYISTAIGENTTASGGISTAMGSGSTASGGVSTAIGSHTTASGLYSMALGSWTTASGHQATAMGNGAKAVGDNSFAIHLAGYQVPEVSNYMFRISGANEIGGNVAWTNYSDKRLKKDIEYLIAEPNLKKIMLLKAVRYRWKEHDDRLNLGFIAQEVDSILPEAVRYDEVNDIYSMEYTAIIPVLVEAMKEQQAIIETQQANIQLLMKRIEVLEEER